MTIKAIVCNYGEGTKCVHKGARAYVLSPNPGWAGERIYLRVKSKGGRWIDKWESSARLGDFRLATVVDGAAVNRATLWPVPEFDAALASALNHVAADLRARRAAREGQLRQSHLSPNACAVVASNS